MPSKNIPAPEGRRGAVTTTGPATGGGESGETQVVYLYPGVRKLVDRFTRTPRTWNRSLKWTENHARVEEEDATANDEQ